MDRRSIRIVYYLEVVSSWCHWAEPAWAELRRRYSGLIDFEWRIALIDASGLPRSREHAEWFYRRSGVIARSPRMLNSGWLEPGRKEYLEPNLVAEAAKDLGITDDRARLAISRAALLEGRPVGQWKVAVEAAAAATGLDADLLEAHARTPAVERRVRETTGEFHQLQVTQRPTFLLENTIGDRAVLSGMVALEPLVSVIEAMLEDARAYASWDAHFGPPPSA